MIYLFYCIILNFIILINRFLRLIEDCIISPDPPPPQPETHRASAYRILAHGPQPLEPKLNNFL